MPQWHISKQICIGRPIVEMRSSIRQKIRALPPSRALASANPVGAQQHDQREVVQPVEYSTDVNAMGSEVCTCLHSQLPLAVVVAMFAWALHPAAAHTIIVQTTLSADQSWAGAAEGAHHT